MKIVSKMEETNFEITSKIILWPCVSKLYFLKKVMNKCMSSAELCVINLFVISILEI